MTKSSWSKFLGDLRAYLRTCPAGAERDAAIKLTDAIETEVLYELRGAHPPTTENFVAMTPAPYGILQRPDPVCTSCGMTMEVRHTGGLTYVIDHHDRPGCPNTCKMWKMTATYIPFDQEVFVPPFVREAMTKEG